MISGNGPQNEMPALEGEYIDLDAEVERVAGELEKVTISEVCRQLGYPAAGAKFYAVRDSLRKQNLIGQND